MDPGVPSGQLGFADAADTAQEKNVSLFPALTAEKGMDLAEQIFTAIESG